MPNSPNPPDTNPAAMAPRSPSPLLPETPKKPRTGRKPPRSPPCPETPPTVFSERTLAKFALSNDFSCVSPADDDPFASPPSAVVKNTPFLDACRAAGLGNRNMPTSQRTKRPRITSEASRRDPMLLSSPLAKKRGSNKEDARAGGGIGASLKKTQGARVSKSQKNNAPIKFGTLPIRSMDNKSRDVDEDPFGSTKVERKMDME